MVTDLIAAGRDREADTVEKIVSRVSEGNARTTLGLGLVIALGVWGHT